jgi:Ner family transcriptional regulator
MMKIDTHKKPAPSKSDVQDSSANYIQYRLREVGMSLRRLSRLHNYAPSSGAQVFQMPWPAMQKHIAAAIGVQPQEIWPSRYNDDGTPKARDVVLRLIAKIKHSTCDAPVNVYRRRAA